MRSYRTIGPFSKRQSERHVWIDNSDTFFFSKNEIDFLSPSPEILLPGHSISARSSIGQKPDAFTMLTRWFSVEGAVAWSVALGEKLFFPALLYGQQVIVMSCSSHGKSWWQESRHGQGDEHVAGFVLQSPHRRSQCHFCSLRCSLSASAGARM